ncbi:hypothetical protein LCGC14_0142670 [marine sediment metagenome]|uniref:Uncharacterized protein n=1 Tax=marine sediment metagenome TaxID=412755 RepID=A0A0F9VGQ5_9ZZZZ
MICDFPRCRNMSDYKYIGKNLCHTHWVEISGCDGGSQTEKVVLGKIGLFRNDEGSVVPQSRSENS